MKLDKRKIKILLAEKCMMTKDLCEVSGVSHATITKGYSKEISPLSVGKLAVALGVPVEEIVLPEEG